jgi:hypothetical protein
MTTATPRVEVTKAFTMMDACCTFDAMDLTFHVHFRSCRNPRIYEIAPTLPLDLYEVPVIMGCRTRSGVGSTGGESSIQAAVSNTQHVGHPTSVCAVKIPQNTERERWPSTCNLGSTPDG